MKDDDQKLNLNNTSSSDIHSLIIPKKNIFQSKQQNVDIPKKMLNSKILSKNDIYPQNLHHKDSQLKN